MTSTDPNADNLLLRLFSYTPREGRSALEDFCTEALAWCLRNSLQFRTNVLDLTGLRLLQNLDLLHPVEIETQDRFIMDDGEELPQPNGPHGGRFDMILRSDNFSFLVIFEAKIGGPPGTVQLQGYRHNLENDERFQKYPQANRLLVSLSAYGERPKLADAHLLWGNIQMELEKCGTLEEHMSAASGDTTFARIVCRQFAEFLKQKGLGPMKVDSLSQARIDTFLDSMKVREQLENVLRSLANSPGLEILRAKRPRYEYVTGQKVGYVCLSPRKPEVLDTVGFAFKESDQPTRLAMHVSKMCVGDRREVISTFNERLKQCLVYKEDLYLPETKESWFNFEQPVTSEYDGNAERMREWFVTTCELVMNLGSEPKKTAKKRLPKS